jgi:AbrB family looped-hinge helix DNA binding protein
MLTTIDGAGRLVVPKALRDRLGLQGGDAVEVSEEAGAIVITRPHRELPLIESDGGILTASPEVDLPPTDPEQVRQWLERLRR